MIVKRYSYEGLLEFQKKAIKEKGSALQEDILKNALKMSGGKFVDWLDQQVLQYAPEGAAFEGEFEYPMPSGEPEHYSPNEFKKPLEATSDAMWLAWGDMDPGAACSFPVWGHIVSRLISAGKIQHPYHLMVGKGNSAKTDGSKEIDDALQVKAGEARDKAIDGCVRNFLRRLSGLYAERGTRSVYQNCPPAKVWWQYHIARQVAKSTGRAEDDIVSLLRVPAVWEVLTEQMASERTIIGDKNIRDGLVWYLLDNANFWENKMLNALAKAIGVMSAWRALGYFKPAGVKEIIAKDIVGPRKFVPYLRSESKKSDEASD